MEFNDKMLGEKRGHGFHLFMLKSGPLERLKFHTCFDFSTEPSNWNFQHTLASSSRWTFSLLRLIRVTIPKFFTGICLSFLSIYCLASVRSHAARAAESSIFALSREGWQVISRATNQ